MKTTFTKSQILTLITLGLIGIIFMVIPIINHSDKYLMPTLGLISWFLFGIYRNYLKNKRFVGKDTKIFLLYNRKAVNIFNLVFSLFLICLAVFISFYKFSFFGLPKFSFFGLPLIIGLVLFTLLSWWLFPYHNDTLIMLSNTDIYSYETGFIKLEQIKKYSINADSMQVDLELKNNEKKSIEYNKFVDIGLLDKELKMKLS